MTVVTYLFEGTHVTVVDCDRGTKVKVAVLMFVGQAAQNKPETYRLSVTASQVYPMFEPLLQVLSRLFDLCKDIIRADFKSFKHVHLNFSFFQTVTWLNWCSVSHH